MVIPIVTRGIRNCNPGNIRKDGTPWEGLSPVQDDPAFCVFIDAPHGIRAMAIILRSYQENYGINTIRGIINRWAPPVENDTEAYIEDVCARARFKPDDPIDITNEATAQMVIPAIIAHENAGYAYPLGVLQTGLGLAGIGENHVA